MRVRLSVFSPRGAVSSGQFIKSVKNATIFNITDSTTRSMDEEAKDQNVFSFMMQLVQEKHGDEVDADFLNEESDRLYEIFGDMLLTYFDPQLDDAQKQIFDQMVEGQSDQDDLLGFLSENISDLEEQIVAVLVKFRADYIGGDMEAEGDAFEKGSE